MSTKVNEKMRPEHKLQIIELIEAKVKQMGSQHAVAVFCEVSDATIDQLRKNTYGAAGDAMWFKIGAKLDWNPDVWNISNETSNMKAALQVCRDAKERSMFLGLIHKAGGGKTTGTRAFLNQVSKNVFYIQCGEWNKKEFLLRLCRVLGVDPSPGYPVELLLEKIIFFFKQRSNRPLLIIDQANSLKPSVLSFLIFLYNECEDKLGVVISGTTQLKKMIEDGVKRNYKGYDELYSRFGRTFVELPGAPLADIRKICSVNGITDAEMQKKIFDESYPVLRSFKDGNEKRDMKVIEDIRVVKRAVQRQQLLMS